MAGRYGICPSLQWEISLGSSSDRSPPLVATCRHHTDCRHSSASNVPPLAGIPPFPGSCSTPYVLCFSREASFMTHVFGLEKENRKWVKVKVQWHQTSSLSLSAISWFLTVVISQTTSHTCTLHRCWVLIGISLPRPPPEPRLPCRQNGSCIIVSYVLSSFKLSTFRCVYQICCSLVFIMSCVSPIHLYVNLLF